MSLKQMFSVESLGILDEEEYPVTTRIRYNATKSV